MTLLKSIKKTYILEKGLSKNHEKLEGIFKQKRDNILSYIWNYDKYCMVGGLGILLTFLQLCFLNFKYVSQKAVIQVVSHLS